MIIKFKDESGIDNEFNFIDNENITIEENDYYYYIYTSHMNDKKYLNFIINKDNQGNNYDSNKDFENCYECDEERKDNFFILAENSSYDNVCYCKECFNNILDHYKVSDLEIVLMHGFMKEEKERNISNMPFSYEMASRILDVSESAGYQSLNRIEDYEWLEFGTSLRTGWLIGEGEENYNIIKTYWEFIKNNGQCNNLKDMLVFEMTLNKNLSDEFKIELIRLNKILNINNKHGDLK